MNIPKVIMATICVCFSAAPCMAGAQWEAFRDTKSGEEARALLIEMSELEILQLCRQYGELVDRGEQPGNAPVALLAISSLAERGSLSQDTLLSELTDSTLPTYWRSFCAKWSVDGRILVPIEQISIQAGFTNLVQILKDDSESTVLREAAAVAVGSLLGNGYSWLYCQSVGKNPKHFEPDVALIGGQRSAAFRQHDARVGVYFGLLMGDLPERVRLRGVPWTWRIAAVRGANTPSISEMQRFLGSEASKVTDVRSRKKFDHAERKLKRLLQP